MSVSLTTLDRCPGCFSLPTLDPHALAVETALRFSQQRYTKQDAPIAGLQLRIPQPPPSAASSGPSTQPSASTTGGKQPEVTTLRGFSACMSVVCQERDRDIVHNELKPVLACVEALTVKCLYPAFLFLVHYDPVLYTYGVSKAVTPKVASVWESVRGSYRRNVLQHNVYSFTGSAVATIPNETLSLTALEKLKEVLREVEKALKALELLHVAHAGAEATFFLGTSQPCSADALVYAAVSAFFHADFSVPTGLPAHLASFQSRTREECPLLTKYMEKIRHLVYEDYSGSYYLRPPTDPVEGNRAEAETSIEAMYRKGRRSTLIWTAVFSIVYFTVANAATIVTLLESEMEEEEAAMEAAQAPAQPESGKGNDGEAGSAPAGK